MFEAAVEIANQYDVPLYCGEYGVIELADEKVQRDGFFGDVPFVIRSIPVAW